ncbi:hypothetical protein BDY19DRAFT_890217 [Irpex rosettiformis]|uniref:Uncharacterized protein n=1 Tax=Irpex rosettiformis TaxID=378272 RepID=A0ACB8U402_9APHY|nr:hypothetical protein BDY19DRAFT_890217 [Irpex rosettiformis]
MSDNISSIKQVPAELWMYMFELMDSPKDLSNVLRTCRSFHNYAIRALHRSIIWKQPAASAHNLPFWGDDTEVLLNNVQSLDLHVSSLPDRAPGNFVDVGGWATIEYYKVLQEWATPTLYGALMKRLTSFTRLHTLRLQDLFFTDTLFDALHMLPGLRTLHIQNCFFPRRQDVTARDHSTLPITSLTLVHIRRQVLRGGRRGEDENNMFVEMDEDISYALDIASAHNLRTLRVDSTADVFALVYRKRDHGAYSFKIPESLTHLYVMRKRAVRNIIQPLYHSEQLFPVAAYSVMERCPTLQTISLGYPLPKHHSFPKRDSIPNLSQCEGGLDTIAALASGRPLRALSILRSDAPTEGILETLGRLGQEHPNLRMLKVHCKNWDIEILEAITQLFPRLQKLSLTYDEPHPGRPWEQDTIVSFGPHYLHRLEHLHTVEIFDTPDDLTVKHPSFLYDDTFDSIDEELRNLVIPWNRYCKSLRQVQLHAGYVMRRGYEGAPWSMHKAHEIQETSDFEY